tara:strand:- start:434 stop:1459 length:1026 start_codon:yes stop_codon:yes gene_type:complete
MGFLKFDQDGRAIIPKMEKEFREGKVLEIKKRKDNEMIVSLWDDLDFNCGDFFNEMEFLGGISGRRNRYYLYKNNNILMLSTGFSEEKPTRVNFFSLDEINFLTEFIKKEYKKKNLIGAPILFIMDYLKKEYDHIPNNLKRLKFIVDLNLKDLDENNYLYSFVLASFYIISVFKKDMSLSIERKKFTLRIDSNINNEDLKDVYDECKILGHDRWRIIFEKNNFYFVISAKRPFRGIGYIYDNREIEYFKSILNDEKFLMEDIWKNKREIDCNKILRHINCEQTNICLVCYREIMARNERNEREVMTYTDSRLKLGIKIINLINGGLLIEKDGRKYRYYKKK